MKQLDAHHHVPFSPSGNMQLRAQEVESGFADRETGAIYYNGVDYNIYDPKERRLYHYKDQEIERAIANSIPIMAEPEWRSAACFLNTLSLQCETHDGVAGKIYWWQDYWGNLYPMFESVYQECQLAQHIVSRQMKGLFCYLEQSDRYSVGFVRNWTQDEETHWRKEIEEQAEILFGSNP